MSGGNVHGSVGLYAYLQVEESECFSLILALHLSIFKSRICRLLLHYRLPQVCVSWPQLISQEKVVWACQPRPVGLPFDWHLPPTRRDPTAWHEDAGGEAPETQVAKLKPSSESPYAVLSKGAALERGSDYTTESDCW